MFQCSFGKWMDISEYYKSPLTFRYVQNSSTVYGIVLSGDLIMTICGQLLMVMELQFHPDG